MSEQLRTRLFDCLDAITLVDPHTHINALAPASTSLADIMGYHYYTELAHSAGMARARIEEPGLDPKEKVGRLVEHLAALDNTIQSSWLIEMVQTFFGFQDDAITPANWEALYDRSAAIMREPDWTARVLKRSKLAAVFLTNDFDDPLEGFDTSLYVPCLRTDDLVFHLAQDSVRARLEKATSRSIHDLATLKVAIATLFERFVARGAKACAISLPPDFVPAKIDVSRASAAINDVWRRGTAADAARIGELGRFVFWTLAECCADFKLPFDLMIGVNRGVYAEGVHQGRDLFDSRVSLIQYRDLFNAFAGVKFTI